MRIQSTVPIIAGIVASMALLPGIARADDAVTLKYTIKVGDAMHQQVVLKVAGVDATAKQTLKSVVKEVKDTGDVTVLETDEGGSFTLNGADTPMDKVPDITIKRDKQGKVTDWKLAMDLPATYPLPVEILRALGQLYNIVLPTAAVKEKDTWKLDLDNPVYDKMKIKIENTYVGIEKVDGVDLWKIKQTATVPLDADGNVSTFDGTFWLNPANGQLAKMDGNVKDVPTQLGKFTFSVLVSPAKDDKPTPAPTDKKAPV
jgi:hypothetical protein